MRLPKIFGDNMVLQRDHRIPVWGWAEAREKIIVRFDKQIKNTRADNSGKWIVYLDKVPAGGPFQLNIKGENSISFSNILVGDVWICSGQSNMEWPVRSSNNSAVEIQQSDYPHIRHFMVPKAVNVKPQDDISGGDWKIASPSTVADFTAVGYFFARELNKELKIPIGLINTSWGGTHSETWTSRRAFTENEEFRDMIAKMPSVNIEEFVRRKQKALIQKIEALQGPIEKTIETEKWKQISFDDSRWPVMHLPSLWEAKGLEEFDGVVWFRKIFSLTTAEAGKQGLLELAMVDDADETYVNGIKVGTTKLYNEPRKYSIPLNVLRSGKNVIAVRVTDSGGGGGIYGDSSQLRLSFSDRSVPLSGAWNFFVESLISGSNGIDPNSYPTLLYNAMLHPIIPYGIKGAIWYQGESNAGRAFQYRKAFPLMINDWRSSWKQGDFLFTLYSLPISTQPMAPVKMEVHGQNFVKRRP